MASMMMLSGLYMCKWWDVQGIVGGRVGGWRELSESTCGFIGVVGRWSLNEFHI